MDVLFLIGRIVFGGFFVLNGVGHFTRLAMMTPYAAAKGVLAARLMVLVTGVQLLAGGASIALGVLPVVGAWLLVLFLVIVAVVMHNFWVQQEAMTRQTEMVQFLKNLALAGAALALSAVDDWPLSLWDSRWPVD